MTALFKPQSINQLWRDMIIPSEVIQEYHGSCGAGWLQTKLYKHLKKNQAMTAQLLQNSQYLTHWGRVMQICVG